MCSTAQDTSKVQDVCRLLHVLVTVRGYKTVVRFFPHEAADLERVLQVMLETLAAPVINASALQAHAGWKDMLSVRFQSSCCSIGAEL